MAKATTCGHPDSPHEAKGLCKRCYRAAYYAASAEREKAAAKAWAEANPERKAKNLAAWRKANPEATAEHRRTYYAAHADLKRQQAREWQQANTERSAERVRAWIQANPEKARNNNNRYRALRRGIGCDFTGEQWVAVVAEFGGRCAYCDCVPDRLVMEHMIPLSRGGLHTAANVVPACQNCNGRKATKTAEEFAGWTVPPRRQIDGITR